jgi:tetratricopeptide (TPR) repeat protein
MRADQHYDDETLIALIESGDDLTRDGHLTACESCTDVATSLRQIAATLKHEDVWDQRELDESPDARTLAIVRGYADEMAREDAFAAAHLDTFLAGATLDAHPEYRTAGMVRALIAATDRALDTMPPRAVAMTELATAIADTLPPNAYATDTVAKLRGAAWRERAYALFYVGRYNEAEAAITTSEQHFAECVVNEYDLGRADIVHALVHWACDRDADAVSSGRSAVTRLSDVGDVQRFVSAVMAQAHAQMKMFDYKGALTVMDEAYRSYATAVSADAHARLLVNMGVCRRALRDFAGAIDAYRMAAVLFEDLQVLTDSARTRLCVAVVLNEAGRLDEALRELVVVRDAFVRFGMAADVAVCDLVVAEIALAKGKHDEVEAVCRRAIQFFEGAGVAYGSRALMALAYMSEAARQRRLTPEVVRHVETYIRRLPAQPDLLFAPLPQ